MILRFLILFIVVTVPFCYVMYEHTLKHEEAHKVIALRAGCTDYEMTVHIFSGEFQCLRYTSEAHLSRSEEAFLDAQNEIEGYNARAVLLMLYFMTLLGGALWIKDY